MHAITDQNLEISLQHLLLEQSFFSPRTIVTYFISTSIHLLQNENKKNWIRIDDNFQQFWRIYLENTWRKVGAKFDTLGSSLAKIEEGTRWAGSHG